MADRPVSVRSRDHRRGETRRQRTLDTRPKKRRYAPFPVIARGRTRFSGIPGAWIIRLSPAVGTGQVVRYILISWRHRRWQDTHRAYRVSQPLFRRSPVAFGTAPRCWAAAEPTAKPSRKGARGRKSQQKRHLAQRPPALFQVTDRQIGSHFVDNRREGLAEWAEVPMKSSPIHTEAVRCLLSRAAAGRELLIQ